MPRSYPPVSFIGVPTDIGAGHRGASLGPEALRIAGLAEALAGRGIDVRDCGNLAGPAEWASDDAVKLIKAAMQPVKAKL